MGTDKIRNMPIDHSADIKHPKINGEKTLREEPHIDEEHPQFERKPMQFRVRLKGPGVIEGKIELEDLTILASSLRKSLERYADKELTGRPGLRPGRRLEEAKEKVGLLLIKIVAGSSTLVFDVAIPQRDLVGDQVGSEMIRGWVDGVVHLHGMDETIPPSFTRGVLQGLNEMKPLFSRGIDEIQFSWQSGMSRKRGIFDMPTSKRIDTILLRPSENRRTISGRILGADFAPPEVRFTLYTEEGKAIPCVAFEEDWGIVYDSILQHVSVTGEAIVDPETDDIRSIRVDNVELGGGIELAMELPYSDIKEFWTGVELEDLIARQGVKPIPENESPDWEGPNEEEWNQYVKAMKKREQVERID